MNNQVTRRIERKINGRWVECDLMQLEVNDLFRMFEHNGQPVVDSNGNTEFTVVEVPYLNGTVPTVACR